MPHALCPHAAEATGLTSTTANGVTTNTPVTIERSYDVWLPAMNVAFFPAKDVIIRVANRQGDQPGRAWAAWNPGRVGRRFNLRVNFGNPQLDPFRATAFDLSGEWYFAPQSIFSVALFKKNIQSFPVSATRSGTSPRPACRSASSRRVRGGAQSGRQLWQITSPVNGTGASLKGIEIALQSTFRFLPGFLRTSASSPTRPSSIRAATYTRAGRRRRSPGRAGRWARCPTQTRTETLYGLRSARITARCIRGQAHLGARLCQLSSPLYRRRIGDGQSVRRL